MRICNAERMLIGDRKGCVSEGARTRSIGDPSRMDSRSTHRYSVDLSGTVLIGSTVVSCRIGNVSLGGVFVRGPTIPVGSHITLRFGGPDLPTIEVVCTARWSSDGGSGLAFDGLCAVDSYTLSKYVRSTRRSAPIDAIVDRRS
jgi:PilZ domain-containing protein